MKLFLANVGNREGVVGPIRRLCESAIAKFNLDYDSLAEDGGFCLERGETHFTASWSIQIEDLAFSCLILHRRKNLLGLLARLSSFYEIALRVIAKRLGIDAYFSRTVLAESIQRRTIQFVP